MSINKKEVALTLLNPCSKSTKCERNGGSPIPSTRDENRFNDQCDHQVIPRYEMSTVPLNAKLTAVKNKINRDTKSILISFQFNH